MSDVPEYAVCENCGNIIPAGGDVHRAKKRRFESTWPGEVRSYHDFVWLCCTCFGAVGGACDE